VRPGSLAEARTAAQRRLEYIRLSGELRNISSRNIHTETRTFPALTREFRYYRPYLRWGLDACSCAHVYRFIQQLCFRDRVVLSSPSQFPKNGAT
jgi:hypothetical protein